MFKTVFKLLAWLFALAAIVLGVSAWDKSNKSEYIEIFNDDDELY